MSNTIVRSQDPRGRYAEGILKNAVVKPGTCLKVIDTTLSGNESDPFADGGGVRVQDVEAGMAGEFLIATEQNLIGNELTADIAVNDGIHYYIPLPGDELDVLGLSGETLNAGTRGTFNAAGKFIASATGLWVVQEDAGALAADTLVLARLGSTAEATV